MTAVRDAIAINAPLVLLAGGLLIGFLFGALVAGTNFCTMGAIADQRTLGDTRRLRAWGIAIAVAAAGTQALAALGVVDLDKTMYVAPRLNWVGNLAGGLLFGFGMVLAGGCASRNLARAGGGDLRALVTLVLMGVFAYMAIGGVLGPARAALEGSSQLTLAAPGQDIGALVGRSLGLDRWAAGAAIGLAAGAAVALVCLASPEFRASPRDLAAGFGIGVLVVAGWALTGLAFDEFAGRPNAPISLTFVRPTGDALEWLGRYTALGLPGFGVATVFGAVAGALVASLATGRFRLQSFADPADTLRNMAGAAMMGVGGVMALGCTVGQGITGLSTLSLGSFIATAGLYLGARAGLGWLERQIA